MRIVLRVLFAAALVAPVVAAETEGFRLWKASELRQRDEALAGKIGPDRSARETLADYGNHRFRLLRRDGDGNPEQHDRIIDVVMVQSGGGTLVIGGRMIEPRQGSGPGEYLGTGIEGGEIHPVAAGDVMHIPAGAPHRFLVPQGSHLTYVLVKFPAP